jgi:hypothetical protein
MYTSPTLEEEGLAIHKEDIILSSYLVFSVPLMFLVLLIVSSTGFQFSPFPLIGIYCPAPLEKFLIINIVGNDHISRLPRLVMDTTDVDTLIPY